MVDSADVQVARKSEAKIALDGALQSEDLAGVPLLVLANKQDLNGAMKKEQIADFLGLSLLQDRQWFV